MDDLLPTASGLELTDSDSSASLSAARAYATAQYRIIPLKHHSKEPAGSWTGPQLTDGELVATFGSGAPNVGIVLGALSNGLVDFDFDSQVAARIADALLTELPA
jgi:hypothetical protein